MDQYSPKDDIPLGRWGDPAKLVGPAIFLASVASSYVNGRTIHVDGGGGRRCRLMLM